MDRRAEHDGYVAEVYSSGYLDYGLVIYNKESEEIVFNHPCYLSNESWGADTIDACGESQLWDEETWKEHLQQLLEEELDQILEERQGT